MVCNHVSQQIYDYGASVSLETLFIGFKKHLNVVFCIFPLENQRILCSGALKIRLFTGHSDYFWLVVLVWHTFSPQGQEHLRSKLFTGLQSWLALSYHSIAWVHQIYNQVHSVHRAYEIHQYSELTWSKVKHELLSCVSERWPLWKEWSYCWQASKIAGLRQPENYSSLAGGWIFISTAFLTTRKGRQASELIYAESTGWVLSHLPFNTYNADVNITASDLNLF